MDAGNTTQSFPDRQTIFRQLSPLAGITWRVLVVETILITGGYFLLARLGQFLAIDPGNVTPVWPASGFALAMVLWRGYRVWPALWMGNFFGNTWAFLDPSTVPDLLRTLGTGLAIGPGDVFQAIIGAFLIKRLCRFGNPLGSTRDVFVFSATQGFACLFSATFGVLALCAGQIVPWSAYPYTWLTWYLGDGLGVILLAPLLLSFHPGLITFRSAKRIIESTVILVCSAGLAFFVFTTRIETFLGFVPLTMVLWAAVRGEQFVVGLTVLLIAGIAIWGTYHGGGPFAAAHLNGSLITLQLYSAIMAVTGAAVAAALKERRRVEGELRLAMQKVEEAAKAKSDFLARVSHELRTPMNGILGMTELLLNTDQSSQQREYQLIVRNSAQSLLEIINDILDVSKIDAGKLRLDKQPFRFRDSIGETLHGLAPCCSERIGIVLLH